KGSQDYPGRLLVPSPIPPMEMKEERLNSVRLQEGIQCPENFPHQKASFEIPAHSTVRLLLDNKILTTGYLSMVLGKGRNARIDIGYAEALYINEKSTTKGQRDDIAGKTFIGYQDKIIADGGLNRTITTLWWRTWRYINLTIKTEEEPLVIEDIYGTTSFYPFHNETTFSAPGNEYLNKILETGWRTARLCANETYMDCPYYEQLQYFGDARIQAMVTMYNTTDKYMVKNSLEQGRQSIVADGLTMSRYPSGVQQFISSYSLWWICSGHDYWMYRGDEAYLKSLLPAYRNILAWYEQWLKKDYSLDFVPYWFFADWSKGFPYGEPIREKRGNSAFQDLIYMLTLESAAQMEEAFGIPAMAGHYKHIALAIRQTLYSKYWDASRGLFADTKDHRSYSQHVNTLAILTGVVKGEEAATLMRKVLSDKKLVQSTIYFRYYLHQALKKSGLGDLFPDNLQIWKDQLALGLTTWAEQPEPSRSDCHGWGASPNIECYRIILGIDSDAPGFKKVRIAPSFSQIKEVSGTMPHPQGFISVSYIVNNKGRLTAKLSLPKNTTGVFVWKGKEYPLIAGLQTLTID
ncbi:MAG: alpha-L-rhamnosidase C-terminal domain-containing protein, partial [Bacteroidales bacterium]|nr:alpha-L-rhamnosidase C-terminal domain-containing protein [Bacteroidales bacterium]